MAIKVVDNSRTEAEKQARRDAKQERKKLRAAEQALRKANFDALPNNAQKFEALREGLRALILVELGRG
jgi:hypothetical protein